ncbi:hypothetical protein ACIPL1_18950 [Pseudomonas sp. NPDC090202]|uniref:hypothetical protein n=1 Tax=unclassified Pseudomonas TaxID=196821 RepID=UPI0037F3B31F
MSTMKARAKHIVIATSAIATSVLFLNIGYYETRWVEDDQIVFFWKKSPTFKVSFVNIFSSDHEDNWNGYLEKQERQYAVDFCRYYVGYETEVNSMDDYCRCEHAYRDLKNRISFKSNSQ